jgi:hypothetical protein
MTRLHREVMVVEIKVEAVALNLVMVVVGYWYLDIYVNKNIYKLWHILH